MRVHSRKVSQFSNFNLGTCIRRPDRCCGALARGSVLVGRRRPQAASARPGPAWAYAAPWWRNTPAQGIRRAAWSCQSVPAAAADRVHKAPRHRQWPRRRPSLEAMRRQLHVCPQQWALSDRGAQAAVRHHASLCWFQLQRVAEKLRVDKLWPDPAASGRLRPVRRQRNSTRRLAAATATA
jgi:hypothetical protein